VKLIVVFLLVVTDVSIAENPEQTYKELLSNIRTILQEKYTQIPQVRVPPLPLPTADH
jgi:hypothetical protein